MIKWFFCSVPLLVATLPAQAQDFDYFLLTLSWSPSYCAAEGSEQNREQCGPDRDLGFTLHGLWPQYENGWPEYCDTRHPNPSRSETAEMADIMGSSGLAFYQWKKHGRCTGLSSADYFSASRVAFDNVVFPSRTDTRVSARELEEEFIENNKGYSKSTVTVTCREDLIREVRICLDLSLKPRACGPDVLRSACRYQGDLNFPPAP